MNNPLISVIVPVYRVEKYLRTCVDSILTQTYSNLEVILVDDGSPDGCPAICDEYAKQDARVQVIHQKNAGVCAARNAALDICTGEYITFIDSDDFVHPRYMETLVTARQEQSAEASLVSYEVVPMDAGPEKCQTPFTGAPSRRITGRDACLMLTDSEQWTRIVTPWGKLYPRQIFETMRWPALPMRDDEAFTYKLLYPLNSIAACDAPLYYYRVNPDSIVHQAFSEKYLIIFSVYDERTRYYEAHHDAELALKTTNTAFYMATYYYTTFFDKALTPRLADLQKKYYHSLLRRKPGFKMVCAYTYKYISSRLFVRFAAKKH